MNKKEILFAIILIVILILLILLGLNIDSLFPTPGPAEILKGII